MGHGRSPRRAGESLSLACCTRQPLRAALSLYFSGQSRTASPGQ